MERGAGIAGPRKVNGFHFGLIISFYFPQSEPVCIDGSVLGCQVMDWKDSQMRSGSWFDLLLLFVSSQAAVVAWFLGTAPSQPARQALSHPCSCPVSLPGKDALELV